VNSLAFAFIALIASIAQTSASQAVSPASIEGVVVQMGTQEPLANARVELSNDVHLTTRGNDLHLDLPMRAVTTSSNGKFSLEVPPGTYRLIATRTNYVPAEYGQRSPTSQSIPLTLAAGQKLNVAQLAMTPAGSISGRVQDRDGEPVGMAQVQALRSVYKNGRRTLTIVQAVETNDRGEYRLFWLAPGVYYVSAKLDIPQLPVDMASPNSGTASAVRVTEPARFGTYQQASGPVIKKRMLKSGEMIDETSIPVYYPGVVEMQSASQIPLGAGATVSGVDISVAAGIVQARHIRGRLLDGTTGQPVARSDVSAIPETLDPLLSIPNGQTDPNGNFDLAGAVPDRYLLVASTRSMTAMTPVEVGNSDLQNIPMVQMPPVRISGKFIIDGGSRSGSEVRLSDLRVDRLIRDPDLMGVPLGGPSFNPPPEPDGTFALEGVSIGDFRVTVRTGSPDAYVKSIRMGNADVLDGGLHIYGPPDSRLEIVVGASAGRIHGSVVNARQEPMPNRTVVLVPDARQRHRIDLYKSASTDVAGEFRIQGIPPGDYQLFSWDNVETGAWQDPDFIRLYEGRGKRIQIGEGNDENVELAVIP
jgi:hypothetical protein